MRGSGQCWAHFYFSERANLLSADNNDATVTDAEIEAFFKENALVSA